MLARLINWIFRLALLMGCAAPPTPVSLLMRERFAHTPGYRDINSSCRRRRPRG